MTLRDKMFQEFKDKTIFEQARNYGYAYADMAFDRHVYPTDDALAELDAFIEDMPDTNSNALDILHLLHEKGAPATPAQIGGRYFGFVNGSVIPATLATRLMTDFWDQNTALRVISPITSRIEEVCEKWLQQLLGLPERVVAGFVSGSSMAIFCGLAAGRYRIFQNQNWDVNAKGLNGAPKVRVIAGRHTHATVVKAVGLLGLGIDNIEWVDVDDQGRIIAEQAPELDDSTILILQAGNVNSGSFEDFETLCAKARAANAWVHIDGAFGLWAAGSEKLRHLTKGHELANSWSVDGHKTLNTPYDSGIVLCDDKEALTHALHASGAYIIESPHKDGMFYTPEMSRRARAIELWAALKYLGRDGVDELVYGFHQRAVQFADELKAAGFEVLNDVVFNQVIVACETDEMTHKTIKHIQQSGECWVGGSKWFDRPIIRVSVCSWATTAEDVTRSVRAFVAAREKATVPDVIRIAAFSDGNVGGNPAGVMLGESLPSEAEMQRVAKEVGFSETAFAAPIKGGWRVRYFSPEAEVPFCGHATIGLGAALALHHGEAIYNLVLNEANITVEGRREGELIAAALQSPSTFSKSIAPELRAEVLALFGFAETDLDPNLPVAYINGGAGHFIIGLNSREALATMAYEFDAGRAFMMREETVTILLAYAETPQLFHTRNPFAYGGVYEDPATGAATAALGGYLRDIKWPHNGVIDVVQGEDMGMRSRLRAEISDEIGSSIRISGSARVMRD